MRKGLIYGSLVTVLSLNLFVGAHLYLLDAHGAQRDNPSDSLKLFATVLEMVRQDYVDGEKLSYQDLIQGALKGMLNTLDPHSEFMEPDKFQELRKDTQGEFGGVGIVIQMKENYLTVVSPMEDTPGHKAGIFSGDRIMKIDGKSTEKIALGDAVKKLRGVPGTDVTISVFRPSSKQMKEFKLKRAVIKVDTVKDINRKREFPLGDGGIAYIRVTQFGEQTGHDLEEALKKLEKQGMRGLVFDLRNNPGGLLDQAVEVCEKFLPRGQLVVSTEGRISSLKKEYKASGRDRHPTVPMVVLVNNGSASASEIVSGCLQDLKRAIVVGDQTFGKGSVQSILPLKDGSALRLTTAKYYTPSHKVIHEKGITPDIIIPLTDAEEEDLWLKGITGGLEALDDVERERLKDVRDIQLDRAMDLLKGITLYTQRGKQPQKVALK